MRGKLIVFYGTNNIGKSTQARLLEERFQKAGVAIKYIKYPLYDLLPSGKILNDYLRENNPYNLSAREAQIIYALNRTQYQKILEQELDKSINIIAEDYTGTGIAWGIGAGVEEGFLENINSHLLLEDQAFLFDGERFEKSIEKNHKHEENNDLFSQVRKIHLTMAEKNNWEIINANLSIPEINDILFEKIKKIL